MLQCVAVCCNTLLCFPCVAVGFSVSQRVAVCCSALQRVALCCSVLQCVAVCCSVQYRRHKVNREGVGLQFSGSGVYINVKPAIFTQKLIDLFAARIVDMELCVGVCV